MLAWSARHLVSLYLGRLDQDFTIAAEDNIAAILLL
jgi:hypothetical protein